MGGLFAALSDEGKKWPGIHCFALAFYMAWYHMTFFGESWIRFNAAGPVERIFLFVAPSLTLVAAFVAAAFLPRRTLRVLSLPLAISGFALVATAGSLLMLFSVGFLTPFFFGLGSCVSAAGMAPLAVRIGLDLAVEGPKRAFLCISASSVLSMLVWCVVSCVSLYLGIVGSLNAYLVCGFVRHSDISRARVGFAPDDNDGAGAHWPL